MRSLLLLVSLLLLGGCITHRPEARVLDAALVEESPDGSRVEFVVEIDNPRDVGYPILDARYTVDVEGAGPFSFTAYPVEALPAEGTQRLLLAGAFDRTGLAGRRWRVNGSLTYQPGGNLRAVGTDLGIPLPSVAFNGEGVLQAVR